MPEYINCPFCDTDIIENQMVLQTRAFYLLTNKNPICEGHYLIVSKDHIQKEPEIENWQDYGEIIALAHKYIQHKHHVDPAMYTNSPKSFSVKHFHRHFMSYSFKPHQIERALRKTIDKYQKK